jgi:hypothetical protein
MGVGNQAHLDVRVDLVEELADQGGLAGANVAADNRETGLVEQPILCDVCC